MRHITHSSQQSFRTPPAWREYLWNPNGGQMLSGWEHRCGGRLLYLTERMLHDLQDGCPRCGGTPWEISA